MFHKFKVTRFIFFVFINKIAYLILAGILVVYATKKDRFSILVAATFLLQDTEAASGGVLY